MQAMSDQEWNRLREALETLAGWRPRNPGGRAVTHNELGDIDNYIATVRKGLNAIDKIVKQTASGLSDVRSDLDKTTMAVELLGQSVATIRKELSLAKNELTRLQADLKEAQLNIDNIAEGSSTAQQDVNGVRYRTGNVNIPGVTTDSSSENGSPSVSEFNNLVNDVKIMRTAIVGVRDAVTGEG